ncbi:Yip1 family protein [Streptomyces sp. NPDC001927]
MGIRPWVVVEPPDKRGLRRITIQGKRVGSAWSLRELRKVLRRLGYPDDVDVDDRSCVYWRGGDSSVWPDGRGWRRHLVIALMLVGLLGSLALHAVIGWADALGALTFAQRLVGVLFLLAATVQGVAVPAVVDYWGRRQVKLSGALILLAVLATLATTSLLLFLWLQEREFVPQLLAFLSLWIWSLWALGVLVRHKVWRGIPHPRKFAAGVTVTAVLTGVSLGYSILYQPIAAPMHFILRAEFGTPRTDANSPYIHIPLKMYVKNTGGIPVYIVVDDYTVNGNLADFSDGGQGMDEWQEASDGDWARDAEVYESNVNYEIIASGQFRGPGEALDAGQEYQIEEVITLPKDTDYETLEAVLQFTYVRQDRGKLDDDFFLPVPSWLPESGKYFCPPDECPRRVIHHGKVRYNDNLINVTRKPRYVAAFWSPEMGPEAYISSFNFEKERSDQPFYDIYDGMDPNEISREAERYGLGYGWVNSEVSVKGLLKQAEP